MTEFPESTRVGKVFSESKFFRKLAMSKRQLPFGNIECIIWRNKLAASTLNVKAGKNIVEIQVFEVRLKTPKASESILRIIDNSIPYPIIFLLRFGEQYQAWLGYKETDSSGVSFSVKRYYKTDWMGFEDLPLCISGLSLDEIYSNFLSQLNPEIKNISEDGGSLRARVDCADKIRRLETEIGKLKAKIYSEKQLNKQMKLNEKCKILQEKLKNLKNG